MSEPEPEYEPTTPGPEPEYEPTTPVSESEAVPGSAAEPDGSASKFEVLGPPFIAWGLIILGILILSWITQPLWWKFICCCKWKRNKNVTPHTNYDLFVIEKFRMYQNSLGGLLLLSLPAGLSLVSCPLTLFMHKPLVDFFWPPELFPEGPPMINDALACFLMPAGLVYAIAFGFAFQSAMEKHSQLLEKVSARLGHMESIRKIVRHMDNIDTAARLAILKSLRADTIRWMKDIALGENFKLKGEGSPNPGENFNEGPMISIMKILRQARGSGDEFDQTLCDNLLQTVVELDALGSDKISSDNMNLVQWAFLEFLAILSYFGILLCRAQSYRMELTMCMMTVFSISMFSYVLGDYDQPYHGVFRVKLEVIYNFLVDVEEECASLSESPKKMMSSPAKINVKCSASTEKLVNNV